jgi:hypothetical protein
MAEIIVSSPRWNDLASLDIKKIFIGIRGMAQVVEHFPSKYKALSSTPSTKKKKDMLFLDL